ncbi:MAG: hypothetical protein LBU34_08405 [Planctomycetaceae bacterium]|nr:hypothetical protein [Planctomycetaceae bacterium]
MIFLKISNHKVGNLNNQHCTNSQSANADATATASGCLPLVGKLPAVALRSA